MLERRRPAAAEFLLGSELNEVLDVLRDHTVNEKLLVGLRVREGVSGVLGGLRFRKLTVFNLSGGLRQLREQTS